MRLGQSPQGAGRPAPRVLALCVLALCAAALHGCSRRPALPNLLDVTEVSPSRVEVGDRVEVLGAGFPEGKAATLTFRGTVYRPGRAAMSDVEIVAPATSTSQNRIALTFTDELEARMAGKGDEAGHATFRGDVVAAFAPRVAGAPPVTGTVTNVVIDLPGPNVPAETAAERAKEGARFLAFVGAVPAESSPPDGLAIAEVTPGSRAEAAGVMPGDVLVEFDGVTVGSVSDVVPSGAQRFSEVAVRRGQPPETSRRRLDVQGFRAQPPEALLPAVVGVGFVVGLVLLFMGPLGSAVGFLQHRVVMRLESAKSRQRGLRGLGAWVLAGLRGTLDAEIAAGGGASPLARVVPYLLFVAVSGAFAVLPLGHPIVAFDLDLLLLFGGAVALRLLFGLVLGGWRAGGRWSLFGGLSAALQTLLLQVPAMAAIAAVLLATGSARLDDLVRAQGGSPWDWNVFRSPALFVACFLLVSSLVSESSRVSLVLPEADDTGGRAEASHARTRYFGLVAEWTNVFVVSGIAVVLFLGGWQLPGVSLLEHAATPWMRVAGAVVLQVKCWGLVLALLVTRWALPTLRPGQLLGVVSRWFLPLSALSVAGALLWRRGLAGAAWLGAQSVLSYVLFAVTVAGVALFVGRIVVDLRSRRVHAHVSPWL